ncbi:hypothetical protein EJB05_33920, partial [Eragrostis curvula]
MQTTRKADESPSSATRPYPTALSVGAAGMVMQPRDTGSATASSADNRFLRSTRPLRQSRSSQLAKPGEPPAGRKERAKSPPWTAPAVEEEAEEEGEGEVTAVDRAGGRGGGGGGGAESGSDVAEAGADREAAEEARAAGGVEAAEEAEEGRAAGGAEEWLARGSSADHVVGGWEADEDLAEEVVAQEDGDGAAAAGAIGREREQAARLDWDLGSRVCRPSTWRRGNEEVGISP